MPKGGMSKNPFAGNPSMNSLDDDFMAALFKGELSVDQALSLRIIKMSVRDYLYFGLGKNGITPEKFLEAYSYLFKVRGQDPLTWGSCSVSERFRNVDGIIERRSGTLLPKEVQGKCFDTHLDLSGISNRMPIAKFLRMLKEKRASILNANLKQVLAYMSKYRDEEWRRLPRATRKGKHTFPRDGAVLTLVSPDDPKALGQLYLYGRVLAPKKAKIHPKLGRYTLKYKCLLFEDL